MFYYSHSAQFQKTLSLLRTGWFNENEHLETGPETLSILKPWRELFETLLGGLCKNQDKELSNLLHTN